MELPVAYPVFICAAASLLMTLYWSLSAIKPRSMFFIALGAVALAVASFFGYYRLFLFDFRPNGVPVELIIPFLLLAMLVFGVGDLKGKRAFAIVVGALNLLTLLAGLQLLKSAGTTWGNDALYLGVYMTINALLLFQMGTYLSDTSRLYGIYKAVAGVSSLVIIAAFGFPGTTEWVSERETALRTGTAFVSATLIVEGALLIYRAKRNKRAENKA